MLPLSPLIYVAKCWHSQYSDRLQTEPQGGTSGRGRDHIVLLSGEDLGATRWVTSQLWEPLAG